VRVLHTSDWHVGKTIKGRDRSDEHRAVLAEITDIARERAVDLVIIAGDVFESAAPTPEAERIAYRALLDLADIAPVVVVSGNHDNERRFQALEPLLGLGRIATRALLARPDEGGVLTFETAGGERAQVALLPWLSHRHIIKAPDLMAYDADEHAAMYTDRMRAVLQHLCAPFGQDTVNIVAGHAMVDGGVLGGGERRAHTIFEYSVSATAFPASAHYVALGHLHRCQNLGAQPPVWYSGSPLQLDFGETRDEKGVLVVEATPGTPARVEQVPLRSGRRLRIVRGTLEQLAAVAGTTGDDYVRVYVAEQARAGLGDQVRELFGEGFIDVVVEPTVTRELGIEAPLRSGKSPHELFVQYLTERDAMDERVVAMFDELHAEAYATDPA
jgi:exonuclease SbcD